MASELAIYYTPMHFMWGVKSGATPDSQKVSSLKSASLVLNLRFFSDLRPFAQLGFTKDLRLRFFLDLVSNLRLPRG